MKPRWWRVAVVLERDGAPWTWTFHVRAFAEAKARALVAEPFGAARHAVYACVSSDPLSRVAPKEQVLVDDGPWPRSWEDPAMAPLHALLED